MNVHAYLVLVALFSSAEGQLGLRHLTKLLIENPIVKTVADATGDALADTVNIFSKIVNPLISVVGRYHIPAIENNYNVVEVADNFLAEYKNGLTNEDAKLSSAQLILKYGFPLELHRVETEDNYILTMLRIPGNGSAVYLMHGLLESADDYIIAGPESGLAYLLAREGYDVWMGNARGNKHSRVHKTLKPSQKEFWDFSWHEIGVYDLPAMIDFVLSKTKSDKLKYVGHSQGTTSFFVMASERPEYNNKISVMVALSPVAFMSNMKSPIIRFLAPTNPLLYSALKTLGGYEFLPDNILVQIVKKVTCGLGAIAEILCTNVVFLTVGFDYGQLNVTNLPVFFGHAPSGASTKQLIHYAQGIVSGEFAKFDYGTDKNENVYRTSVPPKYNLGRIKAPIALFYSDEDWLAHPKDVGKLANQLPNVIEAYKVPYDHFNHLDFVIAKDFKTLIYNRLQYVLKGY